MTPTERELRKRIREARKMIEAVAQHLNDDPRFREAINANGEPLLWSRCALLALEGKPWGR